MIAGTAAMWLRAVQHLDWEPSRDIPRIEAAFDTLARSRESWPAPMHFLAAMPPPKPLQALEAPRRAASPHKQAEALAKIKAMLGARA